MLIRALKVLVVAAAVLASGSGAAALIAVTVVLQKLRSGRVKPVAA